MRPVNTCRICGYQWMPRLKNGEYSVSRACSHCHSILWNRERKIAAKSSGETHDKVLALRQSNPCFTLEQIANQCGITRERVRQILLKAGKPTKHFIVRDHCPECGALLYRNHKKVFCQSCQRKQNRIPLACDQCGKLFTRRKDEVLRSAAKQSRVYCSKQCQGKYIGKMYGVKIGDAPRHIRHGTKYDLLRPQFEALLQSKDKAYIAARKLNIPAGSAYYLAKQWGLIHR